MGFPNWGQFIRIEDEKMRMTNGKYAAHVLNSSALKNQGTIIEIVDALSTFSVLNPEFVKDCGAGIKSFDDLEMNESLLEIVEAYTEQYEPFYEEIIGKPNVRKLFKLPPLEEEKKEDVGEEK